MGQPQAAPGSSASKDGFLVLSVLLIAESPRACARSAATHAPGPSRGPGDPLQHGRAAGHAQRPPHRRPARRRPQHRSQMRQHRDIAHAGRPQRDRRLAAAIDTLAARSPLPVSVSVPDERRTLPATRPKTGPPHPGPRLAPRQWPHHHRPYAQNPLICIPRTVTVIDDRHRTGGYACASSARGGSGASWAQRIAGGVTAPPWPAAVPAGSGPSSEGPVDLFWRG
jgi:hypothetical protein